MSVSDVGLSGIGETNVTSVNVTQETQSPAIRRIYFKHHPADKNLIKSLTKSQTKELSSLSPLSGQWTHAFVYWDLRSRPLRQITLGGKFDRGADSVSVYQGSVSGSTIDIYTAMGGPVVSKTCGSLCLCYSKMIGFHSKTFSGETEKETVWIKTEDFS